MCSDQHHLKNGKKCKFLGPASDLLNQKLWGKYPSICVLISPPGDCDAGYTLTTGTGMYTIGPS